MKEKQRSSDDFGAFIYNDHGFALRSETGSLTEYKWAGIISIFGYKVDLVTTDEISMDIFTNDNSCLTLNETLPGWNQFNDQLRKNIGLISDNWVLQISAPAFETKLTLLFDRKCRNLKQVIRECY
ncbi:hypothetical protein [Dyadobacter psychrotolerans]|uniref:Uncharacterized protein n=1 Tax=Dyadobacter psychrotolerans TaxID=2541721 RepID=A0A4R5D6S5_9BACT|nr:hypothetical protein [Dyadobacter psychrotolerans]TDE08307.1 hypothetical protein E0F88_32930 [Dyadobacter psychrotolerans]